MLAGKKFTSRRFGREEVTIDWAVDVEIFMPFALDELDFLIFLSLRCKSMDWFPHQIKIINFFTNLIYLNIIYSFFLLLDSNTLQQRKLCIDIYLYTVQPLRTS